MKVKQALQDACTVYLPNYDLQFIMRVDAFDVIQELENGVHAGQHQPIAFSTQKVSDQAA